MRSLLILSIAITLPLRTTQPPIDYETIAQSYTKPPITQQKATAAESDYDTKMQAFRLLAKIDTQTKSTMSTTHKDLLTTTKDINLFKLAGKDDASAKSLFACLNQRGTTLACGEARLAHMLANPLSDATALQKRQEIIRALVTQNTYKKIAQCYTGIQQTHEKILLHHINNLLYTPPKKGSYINHITSYIDHITSYPLKKMPLGLREITMSFVHTIELQVILSLLLVPPIVAATRIWTNYGNAYDKKLIRAQKRAQQKVRDGIRKKLGGPSKGGYLTHAAINTVSLLYYLKQFPKQLQTLLDATYIKQQKDLIAYTQVTNIYDRIQTLAKQDPQVQKIVASLQSQPMVYSPRFSELLHLLRTPTFQGDPSLFSRQGRISIANELLQETYCEFAQIIKFLADLDAHLAIANLYSRFSTKSNRFSFTELLDQSQATINLKGFWNPLISSETTVPNNIILSTNATQDAPAAALVTGSNTGGKSTTAIMGPLLAVWLSQTLTISPTAHARITPFHQVKTLMKITDNIHDKSSHYLAEADATADCIVNNELRSPHEKLFLCADEVYESTTDKSGNAALYTFMKHMITHPNTIALVATQFQGKATELEKDTQGKIINLHLDVELDETQKRVTRRTFTIKRGVSTIDAAPAILEELIEQKRKKS